MFKDIAQMEKEIEEFRNNIVASSELIKGIEDLTEATKKQKESFDSSSVALVKKLDACIEQFKEDHNSALQALETKNVATIDELKQAIATNMEDWLSHLEETKISIEAYKATIIRISGEQQDFFNSSSEALVKKLDACIDQFKADHNSALQTLENKNAATIDELKQAIATNMEGWLSHLESAKASIESCEAAITKNSNEQIRNLSDECTRIISEMQSNFATQQSAYLAKLEETDKTISSYQSATEEKYKSFVQRLEAINVDQVFKEVQDLKKSIQTKFAILMTGVGIAVVAAILSIVIK